MATTNPIDFALRAVESIAFCIHAILGLTEPWTGCLRSAFKDGGAMPSWFWPLAGLMLLVVAFANFSDNNNMVLAAQAYIATFHIGGAMYHVRLGHHPVVGCAPGLFAVLAFAITAMRTNVVVAILGTLVCTAAAAILCRILVAPPENNEGAYLIAQDQN